VHQRRCTQWTLKRGCYRQKHKLIERAETLKISKERVRHIKHEYLDMQKLCTKWVPRVLTINQKQQRFDDSEQFLAIFNRNKDEFSVDILQWMKHGCFTTLQSPIDSQPSELNAMWKVWKDAAVSWQG
jgi:hypothetical protein